MALAIQNVWNKCNFSRDEWPNHKKGKDTFVLLWCVCRKWCRLSCLSNTVCCISRRLVGEVDFCSNQEVKALSHVTQSPPVSEKFTYSAIAHDALKSDTTLKYRVSQVSIHLPIQWCFCVFYDAKLQRNISISNWVWVCAMSVGCHAIKWQFSSQPLSVCVREWVCFSRALSFFHSIQTSTMTMTTTTTKVRKITCAPFKWTINALFAPVNEIWFVKQLCRFVANYVLKKWNFVGVRFGLNCQRKQFRKESNWIEICDGGGEFTAWHRRQDKTTQKKTDEMCDVTVRDLMFVNWKEEKIQFKIEEKWEKWKYVWECVSVYMTLSSYKSIKYCFNCHVPCHLSKRDREEEW